MHDFHGKSSLQQDEDSFQQQTGLQLKKETSNVLHLEHSLVWCCNLDTSESWSQILKEFQNVVMEKDEDQLDRSCENWKCITYSQGGKETPTYSNKKANWIGHILCKKSF